jgi:hypothetical protein
MCDRLPHWHSYLSTCIDKYSILHTARDVKRQCFSKFEGVLAAGYDQREESRVGVCLNQERLAGRRSFDVTFGIDRISLDLVNTRAESGQVYDQIKALLGLVKSPVVRH